MVASAVSVVFDWEWGNFIPALHVLIKGLALGGGMSMVSRFFHRMAVCWFGRNPSQAHPIDNGSTYTS